VEEERLESQIPRWITKGVNQQKEGVEGSWTVVLIYDKMLHHNQPLTLVEAPQKRTTHTCCGPACCMCGRRHILHVQRATPRQPGEKAREAEEQSSSRGAAEWSGLIEVMLSRRQSPPANTELIKKVTKGKAGASSWLSELSRTPELL